MDIISERNLIDGICISHEHITKMQYINNLDKLLIQCYLIKKILCKNISFDLLAEVRPDSDIVYIIKFGIPTGSQVNNTVNDKYISCNFQFQDQQHGFVTKNNTVIFTVKDNRLIRTSEGTISDSNANIINDWFSSRIHKHQYIHMNSAFFLS